MPDYGSQISTYPGTNNDAIQFKGTIGYVPLSDTFYESNMSYDSGTKYVVSSGLTTLLKSGSDVQAYINHGWQLLGVYVPDAVMPERVLTSAEQAALDNYPGGYTPPQASVPVSEPEKKKTILYLVAAAVILLILFNL